MFSAKKWYTEENHHKKVKIFLKNGKTKEGILLGWDDVDDNDVDDALWVSFDGDLLAGDNVYQKDIDHVEIIS